VEVGYPNAWYPSNNQFDYTSTYPATEEGQRSFTKDLITLLNKYPQVNGLYWWYPEANGNYFSSSWYNMGLWNNSNHRALKALYELRAFMGDPSAIHTQRADNRLSVADRYNLQGQRVGDNFRGVVIAYGNKMIAK
jgi:arabinogalactan endo-1,4-beta-galactosidase